MAKRSFDDFDGHAKNYRDIHSSNVKLSGADSLYFAEHKVKLLANFERNDACRLLDLGCGDGASALFVHKYFPLFEIKGIDVSKESIAEANNKQVPGATFSSYDGHTIPYENNFFDIVFVAAVFHHVDFSLHSHLLAEIYRVMKPGGRLYLFEHNPINPVTRYLVKTCVFDKDARLLKHSYAKRLLLKQSFRSLKNTFILFFPRKGFLSSLIKLESKLGWLPLGGQYFFRAVK